MMRAAVAGTEVLANPDPTGPPVLLHVRHVARLAGHAGDERPVRDEIARQRLKTHSAWGWTDALLTPSDAEKVVTVLLAQAERAHRDFVDRLEFAEFQKAEYHRKQAEAHEKYLRDMAAAVTERQKMAAERELQAATPPPPAESEKAFQRFLRERDKQAAQS